MLLALYIVDTRVSIVVIVFLYPLRANACSFAYVEHVPFMVSLTNIFSFSISIVRRVDLDGAKARKRDLLHI